MAECLAIRDGLRFVRTVDFDVQIVESDCALAVSAIFQEVPPLVIDTIIADIKCLLDELSDGSCCYVPREGNMVAHTLARESITLPANSCWLHESPSCIDRFVVLDISTN